MKLLKFKLRNSNHLLEVNQGIKILICLLTSKSCLRKQKEKRKRNTTRKAVMRVKKPQPSTKRPFQISSSSGSNFYPTKTSSAV